MSVRFKQEFLHTVEPDLAALGAMHGAEVLDQSIRFDVAAYRALEASHALHIFTARDGDALVGYLVIVVVPDIHCTGRRIAADDGFFMHPAYRRSGHGAALLAFAESCMARDNLDTLHISTMTRQPIDDLLKRNGYTEIERKYEKRL